MNVNKPVVGNHNAKYVVLQGIKDHNVFYCINTPGADPRYTHSETSQDGVLSYNILAYTMTQEEAQAIWTDSIPAFLFKGLCADAPVAAGVRQYPE